MKRARSYWRLELPVAETACPICRKPVAEQFKPFCSRGCKDRDLLNWLGEAYALPAKPDEEGDETGLDSRADPPL